MCQVESSSPASLEIYEKVQDSHGFSCFRERSANALQVFDFEETVQAQYLIKEKSATILSLQAKSVLFLET